MIRSNVNNVIRIVRHPYIQEQVEFAVHTPLIGIFTL